MAQRVRALGLYHRILRACKDWKSPAEATDLRAEARTLFAQNAGLTEPAAIEAKLFEGESRVDLAIFYGIAAPRLPHVVPGATGRTRETILPAYMHSYGDK
eukprot:TRINITY_DN2122_c0_g1_i3.p3 TRINITY_DN2122_c0_g1~~TRINITY_DN2122_c0_g1_i3.p3  ORF type:complete len:101 (+),score=31.58 TRINITY_DN2122_c0_g1_i3:197-499(+)